MKRILLLLLITFFLKLPADELYLTPDPLSSPYINLFTGSWTELPVDEDEEEEFPFIPSVLKLVRDREGRVIEVWTPLEDHSFYLSHSILYGEDCAEVYDTLGQKIIYTWLSDDEILLSIEYFDSYGLRETEIFSFDHESYSVKDPYGETLIYEPSYDKDPFLFPLSFISSQPLPPPSSPPESDSWLHKKSEEIALKCLGETFLINSGFYKPEEEEGVYGEHEFHPKVRITFNNGITTVKNDLVKNLRQISESHGGAEVHYVFRPTRGFGWDILKSCLSRFGYTSPEARKLAAIWQRLIEEMGGIQGGGRIIHYSHSAGGIDSAAALALLTSEEQRLIEVHTFGSAYLIPNLGTYTATNYVSKRDGVTPIGDTLRYLWATVSYNTNVKFVGSLWGIPAVDHPFAVDSYQEVLGELGHDFVTRYSH